MNRSVVVLALCLASFGSDAFAQATPPSSAAGAWMCPCPGMHKPLGNAASCNIACISGGGSSAASGLAASQQQLAEQVGGLLGNLLHEALFGNPEQEARQRAEQAARAEAQRQELLRLVQEEEQRKTAARDRLLATMLGVGPAPSLSPIIESRTELQPILGESSIARSKTLADVAASSAMAQLTRAAYFSSKVPDAKTDEEAKALADAAFNAAMGAPPDLPVPSTTRALEIRDADMKQVEAARSGYMGATERADRSLSRTAELEQQRQLAAKAEAEAKARLAEAERKARAADAANRKAREEELARARRLAREAQALKDSLDKRLAEAAEAARREEAAFSASVKGVLDVLDFLSGRYNVGAKPEDQPGKDAYVRGMYDASACMPRSPGSYCASQSGAAREKCETNYVNGYKVGALGTENELRVAHRIGQEAKDNREGSFIGFNHPRSAGPCRVRWLQSFYSGYGGWPFGNVSSLDLRQLDVPARTASAATSPAALSADPRRAHLIAEERAMVDGMSGLAARLRWSDKERERLNDALLDMRAAGNQSVGGAEIRQTWTDVAARRDPELARMAAQGAGPGLVVSGRQAPTTNDCTIFALANATGQPYGVVAARATELIREATWRPAAQRADPTSVLDQRGRGLATGEVVMLSEAFGRAQIVGSGQFAEVLKQGRPVMVDVVPRDGNVEAGHAVVLSRTFQSQGQTWYEMLDSGENLDRRLYLSARELDIMLRAKGVAYRAEEGKTAKLLR